VQTGWYKCTDRLANVLLGRISSWVDIIACVVSVEGVPSSMNEHYPSASLYYRSGAHRVNHRGFKVAAQSAKHCGRWKARERVKDCFVSCVREAYQLSDRQVCSRRTNLTD
jgi:hypothetical protein